MGYYMNTTNAQFVILKKNFQNVIDTLKELSAQKELDWIDNNVIQASSDIVDIFDELRYEVDFNVIGDIYCIWFIGEKLGSDEIIFNSIAQYVEDGSYIEYSGEDTDMWRYVFENGKMQEKYPTIIW